MKPTNYIFKVNRKPHRNIFNQREHFKMNPMKTMKLDMIKRGILE